MSTETKPIKLMPFTKRIGASGRLVIEPGAEPAFELPVQFRSLFEALERGASLAELAELVDSAHAGSRFRLIKRFLVFLDDHDLLADRDYIRLADSLRSAYTWPVSILSTDLFEFSLVKTSRPSPPSLLTKVSRAMALLTTIGLVFLSLILLLAQSAVRDDDPSLLRSLGLFLLFYSVARSAQGIWAWVVSAVAGSRPNLDFVIELVSIRLRQEQAGKALGPTTLITLALSFIFFFGVGALATFLTQQRFEYEIALIASACAFFTEASPYSRSAVTDLLRSLFSNLSAQQPESGRRESVMRRVHLTVCIAWILFLGFFVALDLVPTLTTTWQLTRHSFGSEKAAGFFLLALLSLFVLNWLADILGSFSYGDVTSGQIRNLWRRQRESSLGRLQGHTPMPQDLERLPFLRQIPAEIRKSLLLAAQVRSFKEGEAICRQGDRDRNLFVVLEGKLAVAIRQSGSVGRSRRKIVAWLDPGAVFGENAFFFGQPRSADVVAMDSGRLLVLPHTNKMKLVEAERSDELRVRIWFLQALMQSEFFKTLPSESLDSILHAGVEKRFLAGAKLIQEGETADACYFMVQGRASVTQKTQSLGKLNAGDAFGEISVLFPGTLRTATVIADTDLITIKIDRDRFWKLLKSHLPLALEIERLGLQRLKRDQARSTNFAT